MSIGIGDYLPDTTVFEYISQPAASLPAGPKSWRVSDLAHKKKIVCVGVVGAFLPVCSNKHIPGFLKLYKQFMKKGIDEIWCISVNDPFVMNAWGQSMKVKDKIRMLSDGSAELAGHLGATIDLFSRGMGVRSDRFVMMMDNGQVTEFIQEKPGCFQVTDAALILAGL